MYSLDPPLRKKERRGGVRFLSRLAGRSLFLSPITSVPRRLAIHTMFSIHGVATAPRG